MEYSCIDTHVHFWKYNKQRDAWITDNMKILQQDYLPSTIESSLKRNGVDGVVAVQADQSEEETLFLKELSLTHGFIKGVVGWVDLQAENIEERLQYFSQFRSIKGFRHIAQGEPDDFLLGEKIQRGVKALKAFDYTYDILIYHNQLKNKKIEDWKLHMKEVASIPNVYCKLSGLFTETHWKQWSPADFYPYLDTVFEAFGTDRLMYGSDWPVILVSGIYVQWKSLLEKYMEGFSLEEKEKVFAGNAVNFYNLS